MKRRMAYDLFIQLFIIYSILSEEKENCRFM
jgi:hypothetical protein